MALGTSHSPACWWRAPQGNELEKTLPLPTQNIQSNPYLITSTGMFPKQRRPVRYTGFRDGCYHL